MTSFSSRLGALSQRAPRTLVAVALGLAGATCTDSIPTAPQLGPPEDPSYALQAGLSVSPSNDTTLVGQTITLTVSGLTGGRSASWKSSDTTVAKIVSTGAAKGAVTGRKAGVATITASSNGKSGSAVVLVKNVPVRSVVMSPDSASLERGDSVQFTASPRDSVGNALTGRTIAWASTDTLVSTVTTTGRARARARGTTQIRATVEGVIGSARFTVRVPQLAVPSIASQDSANAGDTLTVTYGVQNLGDAQNADSIIVRVGLRSTTGTVARAVRRAVARVGAGATRGDSVRFAIPATLTAGSYSVVAYADCRDVANATDENRLTDCLATPPTAGTISESDETDNSRSASITVRGPELVATSLASADSMFTRTTSAVSLTVTNSGSATTTGFDIVAGLYDVTSGTVATAATASTPVLGSRQSRIVTIDVALPGGMNTLHQYEIRAYADCKNAGTTPAERLQLCIAAPGSVGDIAEPNENNNASNRAVTVASNVARVAAQPDTLRFIALGDTSTLTAAAFDRANNAINSVAVAWTSLDPAASVSSGIVRAVSNGTARVVAAAEGRSDTTIVVVAQQVAHVVATPDSIALAAIGDTAHFTAVASDNQNAPLSGAVLTWTSLDAGVAAVASPGNIVAVGNGSARIIVASGNGVADTVRVNVLQQVATLIASPDSSVLTAIGDSVQLYASASDRSGNAMPSAAITWSSSDASVAIVTQSGTAIARSSGTARIIASSGIARDTVLAIVRQAVAALVASPDSVVVVTLGDTAHFAAVAADHNGNTMSGALVTWTSLDGGVVVIAAPGTVKTLQPGRARIVAMSGGAADTVIVVSQQSVSSVTVTPDSALIQTGATFALTAVVRDGSGNTILDKPPAWSTLDPAIALVTDSGRVMGTGPGVARIVASLNGHADTTMVLVNPMGYTHRWLGVDGSGWTQASNWYPHTAPSGQADSPFIPAGTPQRAYLLNDAAVGSIKVASGTSLDLRRHVLVVNGNIDAAGAIDSGTVDMRSAGTLGGTVPSVNIHGPTTLTARVSAGPVQVQDSGRVTINGRTLATQWLGVAGGGSIIETNPLDSIVVASSVFFNGQAASQLTAGVLRLDGTFSQYGPQSAFIVSGTHKFLFTGAMQQSVAFADSTLGFQNVEIWNSQGGVSLGSTMNVRGLMMLTPGGRVMMTQGSLKFWTRLPDIGAGNYGVPQTIIAGNITATQNYVFPGGVFVDQGGALTLGGHTIDAGLLNTYDGTLTMNSPADTLILRQGGAYFGRENLSAGTMIVKGQLSVNSAPNVSGARFSAVGTHTTVFSGVSTQYWNVDQRVRHTFANVRVMPGASPTLSAEVHVLGRLTLEAGATLTQSQSNRIYYHGPLPDVTRGSYQVYTTTIADSLTLSEDVTLPATTNLWLGDSASLNLNGHKLDVSGFWTGGPKSRLTMPGLTPAESLIVRDRATLWGQLDFRGGTLVLYGDLAQNSVPTRPAGMAGTRTAFLGTRPHTVQNYSTGDSVVFSAVDVSSGGSVTFDRHVVLNGLLTLGAGSAFNMPQSRELRVNRVLPAVEQGTLNASSIVVRGNVVMDANRRYSAVPFMFRITPNSRLELNGHTLDVAGIFVVEGGPAPGVLVTNNSFDTLMVGDRFQLLGSAQLSAGTLVVKSDFLQDTYGPSVFAASGTHTTIFSGTYAQRLQTPANASSYFNNLRIDNAAGVNIDNNLDIRGQLQGAGSGVIRTSNGRALNVSGGLSVLGLVLDGTPLNVNGGTLTRFDNVVFKNFPPGYPAQMRLRHSGGTTLAMNNITFLTTPLNGSYWIDADDTDPSTSALRLEVTSAQWANGLQYTKPGNAVVLWGATP